MVVGVSAGTATITATSLSGATATCTVTVTGSSLPGTGSGSLTLDKTSITLEVDDYEIINASDSFVIWETSNPLVASVSAGYVYGIGVGTATITATSLSGATATCTVTVTSAELPGTGSGSLTLDQTSVTLELGRFTKLTPSDPLVSWESSDYLVATVNDVGIVVGVSVGTATITATTLDGTASATCTVTVTRDASSGTGSGSSGSVGGNPAVEEMWADMPSDVARMEINYETLYIDVGERVTLIAEESGYWISYDSTIASVGMTTGEVVGLSGGSVIIGVVNSSETKAAFCEVIVNDSYSNDFSDDPVAPW